MKTMGEIPQQFLSLEISETALENSSPEFPKALSVSERMTFITSRECFEEQ